MSNFKGRSSLGHTLVKTKHNREMAGKICPNMKLTPSPASQFASTTKHLGKTRLHMAFTRLLTYSIKWNEIR